MMAEVPPGAFEIPDYALWTLAGLVFTNFIAAWLGYRFGLRYQRYAELLKAKNAVFAEIDQVRSVVATADNLRTVLRAGQTRLENLVFAVSSQLLCKKRRTCIETAWADYKKLDIGDFPTTLESSDSAAVAAARARMSQPLKRLRDEISKA
jgi:hypothetical protein